MPAGKDRLAQSWSMGHRAQTPLVTRAAPPNGE